MSHSTPMNNRELKIIELKALRTEIENGSMNIQAKKSLVKMLSTNINGLHPIHFTDSGLHPDNESVLLEHVVEAFANLQGALEIIDHDDFDNEWRCEFSNRIMHKSLRLKGIKKTLVHIQKKTYDLLNMLVMYKPDSPMDILREELEDFTEDDLYFRI